jgi:hypothetical protein
LLNEEGMMKWTCSRESGNKKYVCKFCGEISWKLGRLKERLQDNKMDFGDSCIDAICNQLAHY